MPTLILIRHGQSQWNLENRFTGWVDVDLTPQGEAFRAHAGAAVQPYAMAEIKVLKVFLVASLPVSYVRSKSMSWRNTCASVT